MSAKQHNGDLQVLVQPLDNRISYYAI